MDDVWIAAPPRCPEHGQMHRDPRRDTWTCAGWDGEGCEYEVRAEDVPWAYIGTADNVKVTWARA